MAKIIKIVLLLFVVTSVGYFVAKEYAGPFVNNEKPQADNAAVKTASVPDGVVMYYFHGNRRCPTCRAIERYSKEVAQTYIEGGGLIWQTVNVEDVGNKHFIYDFQLRSSGPIIVEYKYDKVQRWQALDKVWLLVRDKEAFTKYIDDEIKRFIQ